MENSLPKGWAEFQFDEIADVTDYVANGSFALLKESVETSTNEDYAILVRLRDYNKGWKKEDFIYVTKKSFEFLAKTELKKGDLFVANVGAPGKAFIVPDLGKPMTLGPNGLRIRSNSSTSNRFLFYYFISPDGQSQIEKITAGSAQQKFSKTDLRARKIPVPPLAEQHRIVAKLDALLARVTNCKNRLEKIPILLKNFRQSVLAAAVSGELTKEWRKDNLINTETDLPNSWSLVQIDKLVKSTKTDIRTGPFGTALKKHEHQTSGIPVWGIESIGDNGEFTNYNKIYVTKEKAKELKSFEVKAGDIIISRSGTVGELCLIPDGVPYGLISTNLMKIVLDKEIIIPNYFCWLFEGSRIVIDRLRELCSGSTRLFLTQTILKQLDFALPPIEEQKEIIRKVEELFHFADSIEARYQKAKAWFDKLPQAILAKAFRGELVEQDENDEPASVLLERIKKEKTTLRQAQGDKKQTNKPKPTAKRKKVYEENEVVSLAAEK